MRACSQHAEYKSTCFGCYLSQPCDHCDRVADHSGTSRITGETGRFCNSHLDYSKYARALND